jgi:NTP pyrophosphatase (non-canonical NTP hydrolase)
MRFKQIEKLVIEWGKDRNIYKGSSPKDQAAKLVEEFTELLVATNHYRLSDMKDAIGDMMVVMTHIAAMIDTNLTECYKLAYNEIKDRKGKLENGIFVKE